MWWRSEVNRSFFLCLAACRMRPSAVTRFPGSVPGTWFAGGSFPLASALRSTGSAASRPALFTSFAATIAESDFPRPYIIGYGSSPSRCEPERFVCDWSDVGSPGSRATSFQHDARFFDHAGPSGARVHAPGIESFRGSTAGLWCSPTDASPPPSRTTAHGSGPMWIATPS